jgi:hypothetical protein
MKREIAPWIFLVHWHWTCVLLFSLTDLQVKMKKKRFYQEEAKR